MHYQLPQYLVFWFYNVTTLYIWWNHIKFWNFCFQLHFLVHIHTEALTYWIIASQKTANVNTFLHYHASACTSFGQVCHIHYIRYNPISCTIHPTKGWLASFVNITLDIVGSHRLFRVLHIKASMHPFKSLFLIHLHVSSLSLSLSLANCPSTIFQSTNFLFILL